MREIEKIREKSINFEVIAIRLWLLFEKNVVIFELINFFFMCQIFLFEDFFGFSDRSQASFLRALRHFYIWVFDLVWIIIIEQIFSHVFCFLHKTKIWIYHFPGHFFELDINLDSRALDILFDQVEIWFKIFRDLFLCELTFHLFQDSSFHFDVSQF